jgi:hypothetical protein
VEESKWTNEGEDACWMPVPRYWSPLIGLAWPGKLSTCPNLGDLFGVWVPFDFCFGG